jgi:anthranilate phosphoribosyltransferase
MKEILNRLFEHDKLSRTEAKEVLLNIGSGVYNEIQITAFTTAFNMRPLTLGELQSLIFKDFWQSSFANIFDGKKSLQKELQNS